MIEKGSNSAINAANLSIPAARRRGDDYQMGNLHPGGAGSGSYEEEEEEGKRKKVELLLIKILPYNIHYP